MKYLIIGGVAGGATAAARLRRNDESAEIVLFERGEDISYANCGLPYYLGGVIKERDRLFVQTPAAFSKSFNIDVRTLHEVTKISPPDRTVTVRDVRTGEVTTEGYDKLVLSPGGEPIRPNIPGIESEAVFTLRNVLDIDRIVAFVKDRHPRRAMIIGAGFIGLEMAENLHTRGIHVTIVEALDQVMSFLDYEMAATIHQHLKVKRVELYLQDAVKGIQRANGSLTVGLASGRTLSTDMIILSIGVRPDTRLAKEAGLEIGTAGGIKVDAHLRTSDPNIYAVGDAIEFPFPITGKPRVTALAGPANKQARIAADNITGGDTKVYSGSIGTGIAKVFDLTVASAGATEKLLDRERVPHAAVITHSSSHAGYYPDAIPMSIKTVFSPSDGRLLGAEIVGYEGVDKRLDLMATAIRHGGTVYDLEEIEHGYAPPYSSAKDPVNIAGFVAENVLTGKSRQIHWSELATLDKREVYLLDVRTPEEFAVGTIDGATNIPLAELRDRLGEVPRNKRIVVFCGVGQRAYNAERILRGRGFENVVNLSGGFKTYSLATQKQSNEDIFEGDWVGKDDMIYQADPDAIAAGGAAATGGPTASNGSGANGHDGALVAGDSTVNGHNGAGASNGSTANGHNGAGARGAARVISVDACGLQCPGPIMRLKQEMDKIAAGERLLETATDPGFARDVQSWTNMTGNRLVQLEESSGKIVALVEKAEAPAGHIVRETTNAVTLIVFSDSLDKALASFVIANGAASAGKSVTIFFTFWGLSVIKRHARVRKDFMGRLFGLMLPGSSSNLSLSKINMGGMGAKMMRARMKAKHVDSLESMMSAAVHSGVRLVACQMSMDIMGVKPEELIDGVEIGGVATYLEAAGLAQANLFI